MAGVCPQVDRAEGLRFHAARIPCRIHLDPGVPRGVDLPGLGRPADGWSEDPEAEEVVARRHGLDPEGAVAANRQVVAEIGPSLLGIQDRPVSLPDRLIAGEADVRGFQSETDADLGPVDRPAEVLRGPEAADQRATGAAETDPGSPPFANLDEGRQAMDNPLD